MKRIVLALLAIALLAPLALSRTGESPRPAQAQTGAAPAFEDASITYLLDAGSNGSSTAIAIGTPAFTAGTITGGTDACAESSEFLNADLSTFVSSAGTASSVFSVASDCAITYTGAASASAIASTRAGWSLTVTIADGVNAAGNTDATADDTLQVTIRLVSAATDFTAVKAIYDDAGGSSWTNSANWAFTPASDQTIATITCTAGNSGTWTGYSQGSGGFGSCSESARTFTLSSTSYIVRKLHWKPSSFFGGQGVNFAVTPPTGGANFNGLRLRIGTLSSSPLRGAPTGNLGSTGGGTALQWDRHGFPSNPFTSGSSFSAVLYRPSAAIATDWHGLTVASSRLTVLALDNNGVAGAIPADVTYLNKLTRLDLGNNNGLTGTIPAALGQLSALTTLDLGVDANDGALTGAIPAALGRLTALTSLNLSGHAGITGSIPGALTRITGLTLLDLSDTGVCVDPTTETAIETWLNAIRARSGGMALVDTCGSPVAPAFSDGAAVRLTSFDPSTDGSTTAVEVGTFTFTDSTYSGATESCALATVLDKPTNAARTGFTVATSGNDCVISWTGSPIAAPPASIEIALTVSDGVDATGASDSDGDATLTLTLAFSTLDTDQVALHALYDDLDGANWTTRTGWRDYPILQTFELTAGSSGNYRGYRGSPLTSTAGAIRNASGSVMLGTNTYTLQGLFQDRSSATHVTYLIASGSPARAAADWDGLRLRIGNAVHAETSATDTGGSIWVQFGFPNNTIGASGDFEAQLRGATIGNATLTESSTWHGVTITGSSVSGVDLSGNNLSGALPSALGDIGTLTSLNLSGNTGLTATVTVLDALATGLTQLTNLDLTGTGICVDPADANQADIVAWITNIRETGGNTGVAKVDACGAPVTPAITLQTVTYEMESGDDGSSTAIAVGAPAITTGASYVGGETICRIASARSHGSNDPAHFRTTGGTDVSSQFSVAVSGSTCAIEYTGSGLDARDQALEAVSLRLEVTDGVDPDAGTIDTSADDSINVTVKLVNGEATDRDALVALYEGHGGSTWDPEANWFGVTFRTFPLRSGSGSVNREGSGVMGGAAAVGYQYVGIGDAPFGSVRSGGFAFILEGITYQMYLMAQLTANGNVIFAENQQGQPNSRFARLELRVGTHRLAFADASVHTESTDKFWTWASQTSGLIPASGTNFDALLVELNPAISGAWDGVTLASNRVTELALPDYGITGDALGTLAPLTALTTLDLSSTPGTQTMPNTSPNAITGAIPATLGDLTALTSLDLSGNMLSGALPAELGALTALTSLDLSGNAGLTVSDTVLGTLAANLTSLTNLDLSGTGVCVDPGNTAHATAVTWIRNIRMGTGGVAKVPTCGSPAAPAFSAAAVTYGMGSMEDGSTTAIPVGAPLFTAGTFVGGGTTTCAIASAIDNTSNDPANFLTTGTARTGFEVALSGSTCAITYTGTGLPASLAAVSIALTVTDGIDPEAGTIEATATADSTIRVTVKVRGIGTDGDALHHLYDNAGGSGWTTRTGWWDNTAMALATLTASSTWHGVTITSSRVAGLALPGNNLSGDAGTALAQLNELDALTSLDLSGNTGLTGGIPASLGVLTRLTSLDLSGAGFSGNIPAELGSLTSLTSLDLSGNAGLTASATALGTLATNLTSLTTLDLSGTAICVDPADMDQAGIVTWIGAIRAMNTNTGVAKVATCGSPSGPAFTAERVTLGLDSEADGSSTAIEVGAPGFTQGGHVGGRTGAVCAITTARTNPSNAPGDFITTGGTDVSGDFAIDGATCAITYTGTGITSQDNVLEAVSIAVTITDGIDPEAGTIEATATADDTVEVTVKLRGIATDRDAIDAFYAATGGAGWTTNTGGWTGQRTQGTFELTAGQGGTPTRVGYESSATLGSVRNSANTVVIGSTTFTLQSITRRTSGNRVDLYVSPKTGAAAAFTGLTVRVGTTELDIDSASDLTGDPNWYGWRWTQAGFISGTGDFDVVLIDKDPPLDSTWHGVTVSGTPERVTGLELPDNNLRGTIPAGFEELDRIASLDLSGNPGIVGDGAAPVTAIASMTGLTTLDLGGIGWGTLAAGLGPALGSLTTLDLSDNRFASLPTDLGMLTTLTSLDLSGNALTGTAPDWIGDLTALTTLDLSGNRFTDVHADFNALTSLTTLDLSGNDLASANLGDIATAISAMTGLTTLDLSGNARLSGSIPAALLMVTGLESLDLSGTGVCVNPATETTVETWLNAIRARNTNTGVAKVATCGSPAAPAWSATSIRGSLEAMADGSTTAITIATPTFTEGTYSGGATETCEIVTAKENASYDPADFLTTGTDVTGFTAAATGTTCTIAYEGTGLTATSALAAISIAVKISDGVDPVGGVVSDAADGTVRVTVKLVGLGTDRIALLDLYQSAGGSGWTSATGWTPPGNAALTSSWAGVMVSGNRLTELDLRMNNLTGSLPESFADLSALTILNLRDNPGLRGNIPAVLGSLVALTSLDLADSGWSGLIPVELGSLASLGVLDLGGNDLSGNIPSELGSLTTLTGLDLSDNRNLGGDLSHLTSLTSLFIIDLQGTRLCVDPAEQPMVETWLNTLRSNGAGVGVLTCGSPVAPRLADAAATYLLDAGADGSSTAVAVGSPTFTGGSYSGGVDNCTFTAIANPSASPGSFLATGTAVTGFAVDSSNCAITWTGSSAPTRVVGTRVAVSIGLSVTDGVTNIGAVSTAADDTMQVTVKLVDLATDRLGLEALYADANGAGWGTNTDWESATLSSSWHGVTVASNRVTALSLADNRLSGRLPALLGDLTRLTTLDLSGNGGLAGGIPVEFTRLRSLVSLDLSGTRVCARNIGGAVNAWLNVVRAKPGGEVRLGSCPAPAAPGGSAGITLREEGPEAPSGLRYALLLECGGTRVNISLGAGERYAASVAGGAVCSLTVTDRQGASAVRGEFSGLSLGGDVTVTIVRGEGDDEENGMPPAGPDPDLERTLVTGTAFARWRGADETPVEDVVEELTLCVVAVYWWDARAQEWRSWFPGAEGLGVNTLRSLRENGIYVFATEERTPDNCGILPDDDDGEDGDDGG